MRLDPTEDEAQISSGSLICSSMPALDITTSVWQSGSLPVEQVFKVCHSPTNSFLSSIRSQCLQNCQERCTDIHQVVAIALSNRLKSESSTSHK